MYLTVVILIVIMIIVFIDIIPKLKTWVDRIHIGRYKDKKVWQNSIINVSKRWLKKCPKIKVIDNDRLILIDILKKNYSNSSIQYWQEASLLLGVSEYLKTTENKEVEDSIKYMINKNFTEKGQWKSKPNTIDAAILAYAIMNNDNTNSYKEALDYTIELINNHIGEDGTVKYRNYMSSYRYVDTIGFICPFLIKYGVKYDEAKYVDLALKQIYEYYDHGMLDAFKIPFHVYETNNKYKLGLHGWGRGLGWFAIGVIDAYNELPINNKDKSKLKKIIEEFSKNITNLQLESGSWTWTVTRKEARGDSSTTATLAWFLINAYNIFGNEDYKNSVDKAIKYLMSVTRRSGAIDFSQGDTKDIGVYSNHFDILPFTQGFALRTVSLILSKEEEVLNSNENNCMYANV